MLHQLILLMLFIQKLEIQQLDVKLMEIKVNLQTILRNGDRVNIITSKNQSPSLHWIPVTKTGKARAAIRRYWHDKGEEKEKN
jgi:(p)ppGpp synthase/HD superfamily hydrolase